jgi:hypothetical protein
MRGMRPLSSPKPPESPEEDSEAGDTIAMLPLTAGAETVMIVTQSLPLRGDRCPKAGGPGGERGHRHRHRGPTGTARSWA